MKMRIMRVALMVIALMLIVALIPLLGVSVKDTTALAFQSPPGTVPTEPPGTVPTATATSRPPRPTPTTAPPSGHRPQPKPPAYVAPTATPTPAPAPPRTAIYIGNDRLEKVIGDRLSPVIYGYTESGWLYRSPDDGRTWKLITTTPLVDDFVMSPANPDVLFNGEGVDCGDPTALPAPLYKSTRSGLTWFALATGENLRPLLAHPADDDILFAADCDLPYLTTDGGFNWSGKPDNSPIGLWQSYLVTEMAAATLTGDPPPTVPNWDNVYAGGVAGNGDSIVAFTGDVGNNWDSITPNVNPLPLRLRTMETDPYAQGRIWFADAQGVWYTDDFGASWEFSFNGLELALGVGYPELSGAINDLIYHNDGDVYAATSRGLFRKHYLDSLWEAQDETDFRRIEIHDMLLTETNPRILWLNTVDGVYTFEVDE